ncbi:hypothetical protein D3C76_960470 [compost metagenome]
MWVAVQQDGAPVVLHDLALQAFPQIGGEGAGFRQPCGEGLDDLLIGHATTVENHPAALAQARSWRRLAALGVLRFHAPARSPAQLGANRLGYITARALAPHDEAIPVQLHIGVLHRVTGNAQRLGQDPGCRQLQASVQGAIEDQCAQGALNPLMQIQHLKFGIVESHLQRFELEGFCHAVCSI